MIEKLSKLNDKYLKIREAIIAPETIKLIYEELSSYKNRNKYEFSSKDIESNLDNLQKKINKIKEDDNSKEIKGIYAFFIQIAQENWCEFKKEWKSINNTPNIIKERDYEEIEEKIKKERYLNMYIGKSEDIIGRLKEHIWCLTEEKKPYASTYSLRLLEHFSSNYHREKDKEYNYDFDVKFQFYYINLELENALLGEIEKEIRNKYNFFIGKN